MGFIIEDSVDDIYRRSSYIHQAGCRSRFFVLVALELSLSFIVPYQVVPFSFSHYSGPSLLFHSNLTKQQLLVLFQVINFNKNHKMFYQKKLALHSKKARSVCNKSWFCVLNNSEMCNKSWFCVSILT